MNMQDPIADMLTRIRNAQATAKTEVAMPATKLKTAIAEVLKAEGYITDFHRETKGHFEDIVIILKYYEGEPVISKIKRISSPGRRVYASKDKIPVVENGLGITIISTSEGVMSDKQARRRGQGGEVLCAVS